MATAQVNGIDTYHKVRGTGTPVLALSGGYGGIASSLLPRTAGLADTLVDGWMVIEYDRRNQGRSQYTLTPFTIADLVADATRLLDRLDVGPVILLASSAAGPIALNFALTHPERTKGLILGCTGSALTSTTPYADESRMTPAVAARIQENERRAQMASDVRAEGDREYFERIKDRVRHPRPHASLGAVDLERHERLLAAIEAASDEELFTYLIGEIRHIQACAEVNLSDRLGEIAVPTLVIHGTADRMVPLQYGRDLAREIASTELHEIEGAGHDVMSDPHVAPLVGAWLQRHFREGA